MPESNLRVVQFIKGLDIGGLHGGADLFGLNLARAMKHNGIDARLWVCFRLGGPAEALYLSQLHQSGVEVLFLQDWGGKTGLKAYFAALGRLAKSLQEERIQILHSHFHIGTVMAVLLKLSGRVPHVVRTAHVDREWLRGWDGLLQGLLIRFFIFVLFPLCVDIEGGVSQTAVDVLNRRWLAHCLRKKASRIYNSIDVPEPVDPQRIGQVSAPKTPGVFTLGSVGRLAEQKGYTYLLEAFQQVLQALPEARAWIAGDGPLRADLQTQARRLGIETAVDLLGRRDDVPALLDRTDLFVLPSIYEGLPTVVLESMLRGVPVIGTDIPGTCEIIRDGQNGWLVPSRDAAALADCILQAAQDPGGRARMALAGRETLKEFSIESAAQKYLTLYQTLG